MRLFEPTHPCDRCTHQLKRHAGPEREDFIPRGSCCLAKDCPCDGYVPAKKRSEETA